MYRAIAISLLLGWGNAVAAQTERVRQFETKVRPLLVRYCAECHDANGAESDLVLTTVDGLRTGGRTGAVLVPGDAAASRLTQAVRYTTKLKMPPDERLPQRVIDDLVRWVDQGAAMPKGSAAVARTVPRQQAKRADASHWAFQPIGDPEPPRTDISHLANNGIDRFVLARLRAKGLTPNPRADRRTLIRRLSFNLIGLPPTPAAVNRFLTNPEPEAYGSLVERLLASPQYGERWGRHWLDAARYADSNGGGFDYVYPNAYHYRDYVIRAFNADKPYDHFIVEQLAGDLLPRHPDPQGHIDQLSATGFLTLAPKGLGQQDKQQMIMDVVDDEIDVVGRSLMGLTLACARCHDHKFDPIPTTDYYALAGIFRSTELTADTDKNPSYWPERKIDHPGFREQTAAWEKRLAAKQKEIADLVAHANTGIKVIGQLPSPVGHWSFDDPPGMGTTLANAGASKARPAFSNGILGRALEFRGKKDIFRVTPTHLPGIEVGKEKDFTISLWLQAASGYAPKTADSIVSARFGTKAMWFVALRPGNYNGIYLRHYSGKSSVDIKPKADQLPKLIDGDWHHVVFTSDRDGNGTVYLDGENVGATAIKNVSQRAEYRQLAEFTIGASVNAFRGRLDDPALWDRLLTPKEVKLLHRAGSRENKGVAQLAPNPEALYPASVRERLAGLRDDAATLRRAKPTDPPTLMVAFDAKQPADLRVHIAGSHRQLGSQTKRGFPGIITGPQASAPSGSGRLELAQWLIDPRHPLTARVIVNRIWQHHFGEGLVRTPDNFGWLGEQPSHPELLDWLARRFIESGWSIKALHRLILNSATWQQSSRMTLASYAADSGNQLLWRMNRRRLEAEPIRDSMLALSGVLDGEMFGTFQTWKAKVQTVDDQNRKTASYDTTRRSIYLPVVRDAVHPMLTLFDFGDPNSVVPSRVSTTGASQALFMMNSEFVKRAASRIARRLLREQTESVDARVHALYELCYSRPPTPPELRRAKGLLATTGSNQISAWTRLSQGLLSMSEFIHVN